MSDAASWLSRERDRVVAMLVGQALDDVESERIDVATAIRLAAGRAWTEGYRAGSHAVDFVEPPRELPAIPARTIRILKPRSKDDPPAPDEDPLCS
jgi:hypothetical protein